MRRDAWSDIDIAEKDLRDAVTDSLRRQLDDGVWADLRREGPVRDAIDRGLGDLNDDLVQDLSRAYLSKEAEIRAERHIGPDTNTLALSLIFAADAARHPQVIDFRRKVLRGRLMKWENVVAWVERQAARDGAATVWERVPLSDDGSPLSEALWPRSREIEFLSFSGPDDTAARVVPVRVNGVLGHLKSVAGALCRRYPGWEENSAIGFVLTGLPPKLPMGRATVSRGWPFRAARNVVLNVSPRLSPRDVAGLFTRACAALAGPGGQTKPRASKLTPLHADLAVFAAENNDGRSWDEARVAWNADPARRQYASVRLFNRDCRAAYGRVTGDSLDWKGTKGRSMGLKTKNSTEAKNSGRKSTGKSTTRKRRN